MSCERLGLVLYHRLTNSGGINMAENTECDRWIAWTAHSDNEDGRGWCLHVDERLSPPENTVRCQIDLHGQPYIGSFTVRSVVLSHVIQPIQKTLRARIRSVCWQEMKDFTSRGSSRLSDGSLHRKMTTRFQNLMFCYVAEEHNRSCQHEAGTHFAGVIWICEAHGNVRLRATGAPLAMWKISV